MFTRFLKLQIVHVIDLRAISNGFLQVRLRKYEFRSRNRAPQALASFFFSSNEQIIYLQYAHPQKRINTCCIAYVR